MKNIALLLLCCFFFCCNQTKSIRKRTLDYDINCLYTYLHLQDTFDFFILHHVVGPNCEDTILSATESIGLRIGQNDTVRVLDLCNTDSSIQAGMIVKVVPQERPNEPLHFRLGSPTVYNKGTRKYEYPVLYKMKLKMLYGKILKI
jgi:hypothetical protein